MLTISDFIARFEEGLDSLTGLSWPEARERYDALCRGFAPDDPPGMHIIDERCSGVGIRRFRPVEAHSGKVLFVHGGGFTIGSVRSHHGVAASLTERLGREVVSVDYRLAPEVGYAEMLADCRRVAEDVVPLALVGDSAGGRLVQDLAAQLSTAVPLGLIYPPVDGIDVTTLGPDAPLLARADILSLAEWLPETMTADSGPPAAIIEVLAVEHDPLTQPLEAAVSRWRHAGSSVGYRCAPGMVHAALHAHASLAPMQSAWQEFCQALKDRIDAS